MIIPSLEQAIAFNASIREADEWFDEPDELERVEKVLDALIVETDPVAAAATILSRLTRASLY